MADVKGVILNGGKYEILDAEARQLAGDAINQTEALENTVSAIETDVEAVKIDLATVTQTATEAKTAATEANSLATQAETRAQEAYELAEKAKITTGIVTSTTTIPPESFKNISENDIKQLFGDTLANIKGGPVYLLHFYGRTLNGNIPTDTFLGRIFNNSFNTISSANESVSVSSSDGIITISNLTQLALTIFIEAVMQR